MYAQSKHLRIVPWQYLKFVPQNNTYTLFNINNAFHPSRSRTWHGKKWKNCNPKVSFYSYQLKIHFTYDRVKIQMYDYFLKAHNFVIEIGNCDIDLSIAHFKRFLRIIHKFIIGSPFLHSEKFRISSDY